MTTPEPRPRYEMVQRKVGDLWIDEAVQRKLKKTRVEKMAKEFKPDALGTLTTSFRSADRIHVIDGQHRYAAATASGYDGVIMTQEYHGLTIPEEAALFRLLNTTEKVSRVDEFLIGCVAQDPKSVELAAIIADAGWRVSVGQSKGVLMAIAHMERVYALSPDAATAALHVLTKAYGHEPAAVQGPLLAGLGRVVAKHGFGRNSTSDVVDLNELAERLSKVEGGPNALVAHARGQKLSRSGDVSSQVARVIVDLYNQRRRTKMLPRWE